jgi:alanine racemase
MDATARARHPAPMTEEDFQAARLTVRLGAIAANYRTYRRMTGPASVAAVVKADAYGLGAAQVAPALAGVGCDSFFVARLEEGVRLRKLLADARIFVLDGAQPDAVPALLTHRLTPALNSLAEIAAWSAAAKISERGAARTTLDAVLHVDTGMSRLGLPADELAILAAEARTRLAGLNIVLVMSHLACGDEAANSMNAEQLSRFQQALAMLPAAPASLAASHGAMLGPDYHFDLVRPGIGLYGANPQSGGQTLMQVAFALTGKLLQLRQIDSGASVGYAATFRAKRPTMLATVALGYADGIPRSASNSGFAAIQGVRAPIVGRVSMDVLVLDVTDMAEPPRVGDDVELIGDTVTLGDAAKAAGTNEYEILTRLGHRLPRVYREGASA